MTVSLKKSPKKFVINGRLFTRHPELGWLLLGAWGWQPIRRPF
jgi:hypothetical protein